MLANCKGPVGANRKADILEADPALNIGHGNLVAALVVGFLGVVQNVTTVPKTGRFLESFATVGPAAAWGRSRSRK
jgi:hypothetical protein